MRIGITGQAGFVGTHLFNFFGLQDNVEQIPFEDSFFDSAPELEKFVRQCDIIVHLAAMNRHNDPETLYKTNILLVEKLIAAMEKEGVRPHVLLSSSTQEADDNLYGKSKKEGRILLEEWAKEKNASFTGMIIPNVFGPFGHPFYNSVVATFCHLLNKGDKPEIHVDKEMDLIYVGELVEVIYKRIQETATETIESFPIAASSRILVSDLLKKLSSYREQYTENGILPSLDDSFDRNLFNTYVCYADLKNFFPISFKQHADDRGSFVEVVKLNSGGQVSFSTTKPGITRGNHFHTRKAERFAVIKGKARIQLRRIGTNEVINYMLDGDDPACVDMPVWYTHNITNIGDEDLYTIFWINEHFDQDDPDTYFENVELNK